MSGPMYLIEYLGDLTDPLCAYPSLESALARLVVEFGRLETNIDGDSCYRTPDPEDDRIVVWEAKPGEICKVVWHFSGWHWESDAADLPGGPLEQGVLPGFDESLYDLAMKDY